MDFRWFLSIVCGGGNGELCTVILACEKKNVSGMITNMINRKIEFIYWDFLSLWTKIDVSFVNEYKDTLEELYAELGDEKSRQCMEGYINQKITGKFEYLKPLWTQNQYYEKELVHLNDVSCIVDCGAYDGDTFCSFCENYKQDTGKDYVGQAFLLEPMGDNHRKLQERFSGISGVVTIKLGAWNEKTFLGFNGGKEKSQGGKISKSGRMLIEVDKIDNIVPQSTKVDFIKMDIEGSELNALKGAENIIRKYHPILTVCVYHKTEDLVTIPQYIKSLYADYKLYLRAHSNVSQDLVLYALPY